MEMIENAEQLQKLLETSSVPRVIWCCWFGSTMSANRIQGLETMRANLGVPLCLVTDRNLNEFVLTDYPLHKAWNYLSDVHKSDYMRIYLLHHYGGGWHDIKPIGTSYAAAFDSFDDKEVYMVGKPEVRHGAAKVYDEQGRWMPRYRRDLVATNRWIGRAATPLSHEMIDQVEKLLDDNLEQLRLNPAKTPYDRKAKSRLFGLVKPKRAEGENYPLEWTVFGNIFHPLNYKYRAHILRTLPFDEDENLGLPYR